MAQSFASDFNTIKVCFCVGGGKEIFLGSFEWAAGKGTPGVWGRFWDGAGTGFVAHNKVCNKFHF